MWQDVTHNDETSRRSLQVSCCVYEIIDESVQEGASSRRVGSVNSDSHLLTSTSLISRTVLTPILCCLVASTSPVYERYRIPEQFKNRSKNGTKHPS
jgi:cytochrome c-type biogenesis protein CcmH/NrfG